MANHNEVFEQAVSKPTPRTDGPDGNAQLEGSPMTREDAVLVGIQTGYVPREVGPGRYVFDPPAETSGQGSAHEEAAQGMTYADIGAAWQAIANLDGEWRPFRRPDGLYVLVQEVLPAPKVAKPPQQAVAQPQAVRADDPDPASADEEEFVYTTWKDDEKLVKGIRWLWPHWIARGFVHVLGGYPGWGKSINLLYCCACVVQGWRWPNGDVYDGKLGKVMWLESESGQPINISRAKAWGLPRDQFVNMRLPLENANILRQGDRDRIREVGLRLRPQIIIVDSIAGATGGESNKADVMTAPMQFLAELARDTDAAVVATHALKKPGLPGTELTVTDLRGSGSIGYLVRGAWLIDRPDPANKNVRRLFVDKTNLCKPPPPIGFEIWEDEHEIPHITYKPAPEPQHVVKQTDLALAAVNEALASGPRPTSQLDEELAGKGLTAKQIRDAKEKAKVVSYQVGRVWMSATSGTDIVGLLAPLLGGSGDEGG